MTAVTLRQKARAMAAPKASWIGKRVRRYVQEPISHFVQKLAPPERRAMAEIAGTADLLVVGDRTYIVAEVSPAALDAIAAFDVQGENMEDDDEDCCAAGEDGSQLSSAWWASESEDDEDGDPPEEDDPAEQQCEDEGAQCEDEGAEEGI